MNSRHLLGRRGLYLTFLLAVAALLVTAGPAAARLRYSAQTYAYITNYFGDSVSVIDTSDVRRNYNPVVQTTLPLEPSGGSNPFGIAVPPVNRYSRYEAHRAYTANNSRDATMSVIESTPGPDPKYDPWSHRVVATVPVPGCNYPRGIAAHPDGTRVFLACSDGNVVTVATATLAVVDNVNLGNGPGSSPYGIHVTPGGQKIYVTDQTANNMVVLRANGDHLYVWKKRTLPFADDGRKLFPEGVHVDPRGRTVWIAYAGGGRGEIGVSVYDAANESTMFHIRFDDDAQPASVYARHHRWAFVTLYHADEVAAIRLGRDGRIRIRRTPVGDAPQGLTVDKKRNVYVANNGGDSVTAVFRRRRVPSLTLSTGAGSTAFGEFIAPWECRRCAM